MINQVHLQVSSLGLSKMICDPQYHHYAWKRTAPLRRYTSIQPTSNPMIFPIWYSEIKEKGNANNLETKSSSRISYDCEINSKQDPAKEENTTHGWKQNGKWVSYIYSKLLKTSDNRKDMERRDGDESWKGGNPGRYSCTRHVLCRTLCARGKRISVMNM